MSARWLVVVAVLCAWAGEVRAEARAAQVLIWGGGASRAEAEASLATYREGEKTWAGTLTLAEGYPRIVESQSVSGLKPGFVVVLLGVCAPEEGAKRLGDFKAFEPAVYSREVTWSEALACPKQGPNRRIEETRSWKKKDGTLTAVLMVPAEGSREDAALQWLIVMLRSPQGRLIERVERSGSTARETYSGQPEFAVDLEDAWPKVMTLSVGGGCTGGPNVTVEEDTYRTRGGKMEVQRASELIVDNTNSCDE